MNPENLWEAANQWPASQRGDSKPSNPEGWEEMDRWFKASQLTPDGTHTEKSLEDQLQWLANIRKEQRERKGK